MSEKPKLDTETRPGLTAGGGEPRPAGADRVTGKGPFLHMALAAGSTVFVMFLVWEALEQWEKAISLEPDNRLYRSNIKRLKELVESNDERHW